MDNFKVPGNLEAEAEVNTLFACLIRCKLGNRQRVRVGVLRVEVPFVFCNGMKATTTKWWGHWHFMTEQANYLRMFFANSKFWLYDRFYKKMFYPTCRVLLEGHNILGHLASDSNLHKYDMVNEERQQQPHTFI